MADNSHPLVAPADLIVQVHYNEATGAVWVSSDSRDPERVLGVLLRGLHQVLTTKPRPVTLEPR